MCVCYQMMPCGCLTINAICQTLRVTTCCVSAGILSDCPSVALKMLLKGYYSSDSGSGQVGFVVDKVALGQVFSEYLGFPCHSSFHQILHPHNHPGQVQ
jgi:hypothetical protein